MPKLTVVSLTALSLALLASGCQPRPDEVPPEGPGVVEDTDLSPDVQMEVGDGWTVRTPDGKACVHVPQTAVPDDRIYQVHIQRLSPRPDQPPADLRPGFRRAEERGLRVLPPMYDIRVTDGGTATQFADSVVFAMCVHDPENGWDFAGTALARDDSTSPDSLDYLPVVPVPNQCHLRCDPRGSAAQVGWRNGLLGGGVLTPTPAYATLAEEGLGGKGRGTSVFAAVERSAAGEAAP